MFDVEFRMWPFCEPPGGGPAVQLNFNLTGNIRDYEPGPPPKATLGPMHLVVTLERVPTGTVCCLYLNGVRADGPTLHPYWVQYDGGARGNPEVLYNQDCDEVRLYNGVLDAIAVNKRYQLGRFIVPSNLPGKNPTFRSPRYKLGGPSRFKLAHWTGIPSGYVPERIGTKVRLRLYDGNLPVGNLMGSPIDLTDPGVTQDLSALDRAHAFDYEVEFTNLTGDMGSLDATPYFEGIWISLDRSSSAAYWTRYATD